MQLVDDFHHIFTAGGIQCTGRFVGKDDFSAIHQRAGDGDTLLLTAGKLSGFVAFFAFQTQILQKLLRTHGTLFAPHAHINSRQSDIIPCRQRTQQVIALEDKAETFSAQCSQLVRLHFGRFKAADPI